MAEHEGPYFMENGRAYGTFRRGMYLLPCDATERDRLDIMHTMIKTARATRATRLINAPTESLSRPPDTTGQRSRVLDLGCGTGIWLLEMAEQWPDAEYLGVDINPMGPSELLPNVDIRVPWDFESPWALGEGSWDIIHMQMALGSVSHWPTLYGKILRHLRPGTGWFESVEIDWQPRCEDGTLSPGKLTQWWERYVSGVYAVLNRHMDYNPRTGELLAAAGFRDIHHVVYRLPMNGWAVDKAEHRAGMWWDIAMSPGHQGNGGYGMEAISMAPMSRVSGWNADHVRRLCVEAHQEASNPQIHAFNHLHIWWARAPHPHER